ncbi:MAG: FtsX-like permease family protein [Lachnospiraceae bacterium]|nr:FtsX-like permease family protein [Lachnospiraceae bacterium]
MRKASTKDILRTIWKEKKRFISIMMITVLGVTLMTGLEAGCRDLKLSADRFYDSQKLFDISIMSTLGLTEDDVLAIQRMEEVEKAEGTFSEIVHTKNGDVNRTAEVKIVRENGLNVPYVLEGRLPKEVGEIAVSETYLKETGKSLGDKLSIEEIMDEDSEEDSSEKLTETEEAVSEEAEDEISLDIDSEVELEEEETPNFLNTEFTVVGTVIDVMDINNAESAASFRATPNADYTFFVTADAVESDVYTAVYVALEDTKELLCYSDEYEEKIESVTQWIEAEIMGQRELARYEQITEEAYDKIAEKEAEMLDAFAEVEEEFFDAEEEIADARKEIRDGWKKIRDGWKELEDGKQELLDGRQELEDGRKELEDGKLELADAEKEAKEEIANARKELADAQVKLDDAWYQLNQAEKQLNMGEAQLEDGKEELIQKEKEAKTKLDGAKALLDKKVSENEKLIAELETNLEQIKLLFRNMQGEDEWAVSKEISIPLLPDNIMISMEEAWEEYVLQTEMLVLPLIAEQMNAETSMNETQMQDAIHDKMQEAATNNVQINPNNNYSYGTVTEILNAVIAKSIGEKQAILTNFGVTENNLNIQKENLETELQELLNQSEADLDLIESKKEELSTVNGTLMILGWDMPKDEEDKEAGDDTKNLFTLATGIATCNATTQVLNGALAQFETEKASALAQIEDAWKDINKAEDELRSGREQLSKGREEVSSNYQKWRDGVKELDENEQKALQEIADKWIEIAEAEQDLLEGELELLEGEQELIDGEKELIKGEKELRDGERDLAEGEQELAEHKLEYQEERAKAEDKIAEAKQKVSDIDMTKWYVQDRTSLSGYVNVDSDTASIESLSTVFTVVFFVVAILISLTTVTRMVEEERGLIGTYKALGFTDSEIRRKYVIYALGASVLGAILGDVGGFIILPEILFVFFRVMYYIPSYLLKFEVISGTLSGLFFIVGIAGAALVACYSELKHVPAHLMRPKAPKEGSRVFLEYIKPLWKRMSFLNKVTARNLFRYKKRMFMTLFGIMGCTALLVFGLAIKDSVSELMPLQYENVYSYDLLAATSADDNDKLISYMEESTEVEEYLNIQVESVKLKNEDKESEKVQLMVLPDGVDISKYFTLKNEKEEPIKIGSGGIYLTENASKILKLEVGDTAYIQKLDLTQEEVVVTSLVKNYLGNNIYMSESAYEEIFGVYEPNGILANLSEDCTDQISFSNKLAEEDWILSSVSTEDLKGTFSQAFTLINIVVYVVLVLAACLAFVVLFTLASINISERERELATIKVLGFYDKEVHSYVNKETLILTTMGILMGLPVGAVLSSMLTDILNMPSIYFAVTIYDRSYFIAGGIALVFAFIVQFLTDRSLDVIDPVEALKSVE